MARELPRTGTPGCAAGPGEVGAAPSPAAPAPGGWSDLPPDAVPGPPPAAAPPASAQPLVDPAAPAGERWRLVVEEVEKVTPLAAPALKQATLLWIREGEVGVQLPQGMMAATTERRRADIEAVFARCFGRPTRLELKLGAAAPEAAAGEAAPLSIAATEAAERLARSHRVRDAARHHPGIQEAARILEGGTTIEEL
jgi:DNA polymerase-3 subunit gamma/tau